jgi:poly(glycerol-phosphate) alpha-glucosyltransferase
VLRRRAADLGVAASVVFLGPRFGEEKNACYRHCDAFVLPSLSEGLPMVILEAWAYARPVLMTPECNLPEGFAAGAAVRMEATSQSIAEGLRQLLGVCEADRLTMGRRGRSLVEQRYSWPETARQLRSVHEWLLGRRPAPDSVESA